MRLRADELAALLRAHAYVQVERPPTLWDLETESMEAFVRVTGEFLAAGLAGNGGDLGALRLGVANIVVTAEAAESIPAGDYVAISLASAGNWTDGRWQPGRGDLVVNSDLTLAVSGSGAVYAYSRRLSGDSGAVTALFPRHLPTADAPMPGPESPRADPEPPPAGRSR